ncbi:MAG: hypothetical protein E7231_08955 [Cellulosilyticum sp.]|nr:hypothetical protein [Cellulosilyticum sp.]
MDILVLDAPMKFIHGKMVEQGAQEWSRYLNSQFNPIGRGTLYSEHFDRETGLRVFLYSAAITLECVGESKGYLKVIKAEETDVVTYHKVIEEGKLLEEKITFVPVYKFQYINGKEHHDVERFMQVEEQKKALESYVEEWYQLIAKEHSLEQTDEQKEDEALNDNYMVETLKKLYAGQTANKEMRTFMPDVVNLKAPLIKSFLNENFTMHYEMLSQQEKQILSHALSTEDVYFIHTQSTKTHTGQTQIVPAISLIKEMVEQGTSNQQKVMVVAPNNEQVEAILGALEECRVGVAGLHDPKQDKEGKYTLAYQIEHMKESVLKKLNEEESKHSKHKEELDQMKKECDIYHNADRTIKLGFEILALLKEIEEEQVALKEESEALGHEGMSYVEALERYENISKHKREVYQKLKEALKYDAGLYEELIWMEQHGSAIHYQEYKDLVLEYDQEVQVFEEKLKAYQAQIAKRSTYEDAYKQIELELLELRRKHLKTEALKQVDFNETIETDETLIQKIEALEAKRQALDEEKAYIEMGIISTRHLDEMKVKLYELKEKVEAYIAMYSFELGGIYCKEDITKAEVIDIFKRMQRVEALFEEDEAYVEYLDGLEEYFEIEAIVKKNEQLLGLQQANQDQMMELLKKQQEVHSLLTSKLEEAEFKAFLDFVDEGQSLALTILENPLGEASLEALEILETAVAQRDYKLQVYKEKVDFYEELSKLKADWKQSLMEDEALMRDYLVDQIKAVGTTCHALLACKEQALVNGSFEYVIISEAHQITGLDMLIPMIQGKKIILLGDATSNLKSLFTHLYQNCPKENKSSLETFM